MERTLSEEEADELAKNKLCLVYTLTKSGNCTNLHFDQVSSCDNDLVHVRCLECSSMGRNDESTIFSNASF